MLGLAPYASFTSNMTPQQLYVVCSLCATLMIARSPASAIAVLQESGGKGPFCSLVLTVVIVKDVLTIVLFSVNIEVARVLFSPGNPHFSLLAFTKPLVSVLVAISLGAASSYVMNAGVHTAGAFGKAPQVARMVVAVLGAFLTFEAAAQLDAEPLLACAISGLLSANRQYVFRCMQEPVGVCCRRCCLVYGTPSFLQGVFDTLMHIIYGVAVACCHGYVPACFCCRLVHKMRLMRVMPPFHPHPFLECHRPIERGRHSIARIVSFHQTSAANATISEQCFDYWSATLISSRMVVCVAPLQKEILDSKSS